MADTSLQWFRVLGLDELPEGRVTTAITGHKSLAITHYQGQYGALDNRCPHQGGPLGEGSIENGLLRCPWHGWDYCPLTGQPPGDLDVDDALETFPIEVREDGIYVGLATEPPHTRTVTDVMAETMVNWGITHVFGMVGHSNLGLADALRRQEEQGNLKFIGIRHEGAGAFAASAYAKLTGRPAACLTIAGPGATNLLTGLWDAKVDRAPILALTGQVNTQVLGTGNFQECDLSAAFQGVAAWSQTILSHSQHGELMTQAIKHALLERDVAHLIFPDEIQTQPATEFKASSPNGRITPLHISPPAKSLNQAIDLLKKSQRPVIIVGHGSRFSMSGITGLAELLNAPVLTTFKGKGQISDHHPLGCGVLGRSGTPIASWFMNESDVLLVFGASFSNHTGIYAGKPIIQVDFDPLALGIFHPITVPVWGEISVVVDQLQTALTGHIQTIDQRPEVAQRWQIWQAEKRKREQDDHGKGINSAAIFAAMTRQVPSNAVISVDVGNNTYSFGRYFECEAQSVLMSGYLGSIGFGFPGAMGAWAAVGHERPIVSVSGDGGLGQYLAEFTTAVKYNMNITHVLLNNCELGKISKEQRAGEWDVWQTSLHNPDFSQYAQICGGYGVRVTDKQNLDSALKEALAYKGPALVEIITDAELI
ncbi:thiamine pyrophosphate-binding protein [Acaryochloris sp. IP29b_bin.137]|uniref:thiamine pyrophosphate-binding protein n=1 Tax=Acaryochloris sp. IP29b_bin.137 TaxID=2969217 RepID=UPI002603E4A5|nr:thiamine pyrophosphate-binding protein [Acaryochloris sp. IP29b_bin.137]